jgi:hypothetical protein
MRAVTTVLALLALSGCSSTVVKASFNSNTLAPAAASGSSGASVRVVSSSGGAAVAGVLLYGALLSAQDPRFASSLSSSTYAYDGFWARPVPELDPDRRVSEQDCSRPLDLSLGNIRCK